MGQDTVTKYEFGPYTLEPSERRISGQGAPRIELTTKAFDLLVLLVTRAPQLVTKDEILDSIWQEVSVAESNVTATISMIRKALREDDEHQYIETIPKKGYRFVVPVSVVSGLDRGSMDSKVGPATFSPKDRRSNRLAIAGVLLALAAAGIGFWGLDTHRRDTNISTMLYQTAISHELEGKDNLAIKELREVPQSDPKFSEARLRGAWLLFQADRDDDAKSFLAPVEGGRIGGSPHERATRLKIEGLKRLLDDRASEALEQFQLAADADPTDIEALVYTSDISISIGNLNEADKSLDKCQMIADLNPFCGYERIDALTHEGKFDAAIAEYRRLRKQENYPWLDEPAGYAELANGNTAEAQNHFNALAKQGRDGSLVHFMAAEDGIAATELVQGKIGAAIRNLSDAKEQSDSNYEQADYLILMAKIEALHGDSRRAVEKLEEASKLSDSPMFATDIARTFALIGARSDAHRFMAPRQDVQPRLGLRYQAALPFIDGVDALLSKKYTTAAEQLTRSFRMDENPETAYFLAKADMALGRWNEAVDRLTFITGNKAKVFNDSIASLIPLAEFNLVTCYRETGQASEANKHLSVFLEMWKNADPDLKRSVSSSIQPILTVRR